LKELDYEKSKIAYKEDSGASILFRREKRCPITKNTGNCKNDKHIALSVFSAPVNNAFCTGK
jgi:hypothetical protein